MMEKADVDARVDVCGVCCPLPLIQIAKAANRLAPGQVLEAVGNDPIYETSVRDYCQVNGHTILDVRTGSDSRVTILIQVGKRP
jgi:TusA-related sulfurtransferase